VVAGAERERAAWSTSISATGSATPAGATCSWGDFNGDGKLDIAGRAGTGDWWVASNTGSLLVNVYFGSWDESAGLAGT